eukprot:940278-Prymnesium_polylepis.1
MATGGHMYCFFDRLSRVAAAAIALSLAFSTGSGGGTGQPHGRPQTRGSAAPHGHAQSSPSTR